MDPLQLPEDLSTLTAEELSELEAKIADRAEEIASADDLTDSDIDEIEALGSAKELVMAEQAQRGEAAAAKTERVEAALAKVRSGAAADDTIDEPADDSTVEVVDEIPVPIAAANEGGEALSTEDPTQETEVLVPDEVTTPQSAAALATRRPDAVAPKTSGRSVSFAATGFAVDPEGTQYESAAEVAAAISKKRIGMTHVAPGVSQDYVSLATYHKTFPEDRTLGAKADQNGLVMRAAARDAGALVASGAVCAPLDPVWEKITLGESFDADLQQAIPTVGAPQGGIRYRPYAKPDISNLLAGVGHYNYGAVTDFSHVGATNAPVTVAGSPTGGTAGALTTSNPKPCATLVCIDEQECFIDAWSTCLKVDNLQGRVSPQLVEEAQADLAAAYNMAKEAWVLAFMKSVATNIAMDMSSVDGQAAGVLIALEFAAAGYRKGHLLSSTATVQAFIERNSLSALKLDLAVACQADVFAALSMTEADVASELRRRNIEPVFYTNPVLAGGATATAANLIAAATGGGTLAGILGGTDTIDVIMGAPGAVIELDGGTLDLGLVRDSVLNGTNDYQIFMEEWLGLCNRGIEMLELSITTSVAGLRKACEADPVVVEGGGD